MGTGKKKETFFNQHPSVPRKQFSTSSAHGGKKEKGKNTAKKISAHEGKRSREKSL